MSTMPRAERRDYLTDQGMRPFTARTTTDPERLALAQMRRDRTVEEHGEFRDGVRCATALVRRDDPGC